MAFKPAVAPIKAGVYPLLNKPEFQPFTEQIVQLLTEAGMLDALARLSTLCWPWLECVPHGIGTNRLSRHPINPKQSPRRAPHQCPFTHCRHLQPRRHDGRVGGPALLARGRDRLPLRHHHRLRHAPRPGRDAAGPRHHGACVCVRAWVGLCVSLSTAAWVCRSVRLDPYPSFP